MQKRKLKKISLLLSSAALVLALTVPVKAATEDVTEQAEDSGLKMPRKTAPSHL